MAEDTTDRATVNSELMTPERPAAREAGNAVFIPKCIKDKKYTLAVVAVITALVITIIALAVKKPQPCPLCPPAVDAACPDRWVGYLGKCYYTSEDKRNWSDSESRCSFLGASLAVIDTKPDLVRNKIFCGILLVPLIIGLVFQEKQVSPGNGPMGQSLETNLQCEAKAFALT
ncbi:C-type lectin domain family 2 member D6-like isoform X2 [Podarcis muralis]